MSKVTSRLTARLNRMRYLDRWPLMRKTETENVAEHIYETNTIALTLALIEKQVFKNHEIDPFTCLAISQVHESEEPLLSGDLNTIAKNATPGMKAAYEEIKSAVQEKIVSDIPDELRHAFDLIIRPVSSIESELVKCADIIQAFIKAKQEVRNGNGDEFMDAESRLRANLQKLETKYRSVKYFNETFLPSHFESVDKLLINEV